MHAPSLRANGFGSRCKGMSKHLKQFKHDHHDQAVMLASLRSLVPKEWDSDHEVAWNWLWEMLGCIF